MSLSQLEILKYTIHIHKLNFNSWIMDTLPTFPHTEIVTVNNIFKKILMKLHIPVINLAIILHSIKDQHVSKKHMPKRIRSKNCLFKIKNTHENLECFEEHNYASDKKALDSGVFLWFFSLSSTISTLFGGVIPLSINCISSRVFPFVSGTPNMQYIVVKNAHAAKM